MTALAIVTLGLTTMSLGGSTAQAVPSTNLYSDDVLNYFYLDSTGHQTSASSASVKIALATRKYTSCSGCLTERVDAAARAYNLGNPNIQNVTVTNIRLLDSNGTIRSSGGSQSSVTPTNPGSSNLIQTPDLCVGIGSGRYHAYVETFYFNFATGTRYDISIYGDDTGAKYKTIGC
jgi:hypothetical protein